MNMNFRKYQDLVTGEVFEVQQQRLDPAYTHRRVDQHTGVYYCVYAFEHAKENTPGYNSVRRI